MKTDEFFEKKVTVNFTMYELCTIVDALSTTSDLYNINKLKNLAKECEELRLKIREITKDI